MLLARFPPRTMHTQTHTQTHKHTQFRILSLTQTHTHSLSHTRTHTHITHTHRAHTLHTRKRARAHTHTQTHTNTCTHITLSPFSFSSNGSIQDRIRIFDRQPLQINQTQTGYARHLAENEHTCQFGDGCALHATVGAVGGGDARHHAVKWPNGHVEHEHDILHASLLDRSGLQAQTGGKRRMTRDAHLP